MAVELEEETELQISPYLFYHTRGKVEVYVTHRPGDNLNEVGKFYLTKVGAELGIKGKSYEELVVFFERQP